MFRKANKKTGETHDAKLVDNKVVNVFLTYKHRPAGKHYIEEANIERIKDLLRLSIELADGCEGVNLIYDRHCNYDYSRISELYNITDVDIFLITEGVAESEWVMKELKDMRKRNVPIIPIRFEGYKDNIGAVCNKNTVDAMPIELADGNELTEGDISRVASVISETVRSFNPKKREKLNKKIEKEVKIEDGNLSIMGMYVEHLKKLGKAFVDGFLEGELKGARELGEDAGKTVTKGAVQAALKQVTKL